MKIDNKIYSSPVSNFTNVFLLKGPYREFILI